MKIKIKPSDQDTGERTMLGDPWEGESGFRIVGMEGCGHTVHGSFFYNAGGHGNIGSELTRESEIKKRMD